MSDEREILGYREAEYRRRCALAFNDDQGRTLENIPGGVFWRLYDALEKMSDPFIDPTAADIKEARALLDSLHIKESE